MTDAAFSLRRLGLKNYRSIGVCDLELGPLAIFVGQNGAGKSNILDSLRFIRQALEENPSRAVSERGGIAEVRRRSAGSAADFTISLEFSSGKFNGGGPSGSRGAVGSRGIQTRLRRTRGHGGVQSLVGGHAAPSDADPRRSSPTRRIQYRFSPRAVAAFKPED